VLRLAIDATAFSITGNRTRVVRRGCLDASLRHDLVLCVLVAECGTPHSGCCRIRHSAGLSSAGSSALSN